MTIDPGKAGTGIAIWDYAKFYEQREASKSEEIVYFTPEFHKSVFYKDETKYFEEVSSWCAMWDVQEIHCEDADLMLSSQKGSAAANTGGLIVLARFIGSLRAVAWTLDLPFYLYKPMVWKGQLPKAVVQKRIRTYWPECPCKVNKRDEPTGHDWDAVGIGYFLMGLINKKT